MKKLFLILCWLFLFVNISFAQYPHLNWVYQRIDNILKRSPEATSLIINKLEILADQYRYVSEDYDLITTLLAYVKEKSKPLELIWSLEWKNIPEWYSQLRTETIKNLEWVFHLHWSEDAPILVIEFIDFQCPYCQRQHNDAILDKLEYDLFPGEVRTWVWMFPLWWSRHKLAQQAAESAECAFDQWWIDAYINHKSALFAWWLQPTMSVIKRAATDHWLNPDLIEACTSSWENEQKVLTQKQRWINLWIRWTPGSVVIDVRSWAIKNISWARSLESFQSIVQTLLDANN